MSRNLIVYFVPPRKAGGGVMSIFSQAKESRRFEDIHHAEVVIATYPGEETYRTNDLFDNDEKVLNFDEVVAKWPKIDSILFHIPENGIRPVVKSFNEAYSSYLESVPDISMNVMTQNIKLLPRPALFAELFKFTDKVTQTTAHERYSTQQLSEEYLTPVKHLSTFVDESQYYSRPFKEKRNLIVYSPDEHPMKSAIVNALATVPNFELREIKDLSYDNYKKLLSEAKFSVTFGEGLDGYFIEMFLSGGIGISSYNQDFFPDSFKKLETVFPSYEQMEEKIADTIVRLNQEDPYDACHLSGKRMVNQLYNFENYLQNLKDFYLNRFDYVPGSNRPLIMIRDLLAKKDEEEHFQKELTEKNEALKLALESERARSARLEERLSSILSSKSWRVVSSAKRTSSRFRKK